MRVVFFGSPAFALPALRALVSSEHEIVAVYTQPDRPAGRGRKPSPPPVKALAVEHGLQVRQPRSVSRGTEAEALRALGADVGVLAAYGQILRRPVIDAFPLGILNIHASLLPRWRGAAPVVAAILHGDKTTGATIMQIVEALDAGPMLASRQVPIADDDTAGTLSERIAEVGADLLLETLPRWGAREIEAEPQDDALATYAPRIEKADALIHWARDDAATIARQVRAYNPWPMAYSCLEGEQLRITRAIELAHRYDGGPPGTLFMPQDARPGVGFAVATRGLDLGVMRVQPAGRREMEAADFLRGRRDILGRRLTA